MARKERLCLFSLFLSRGEYGPEIPGFSLCLNGEWFPCSPHIPLTAKGKHWVCHNWLRPIMIPFLGLSLSFLCRQTHGAHTWNPDPHGCVTFCDKWAFVDVRSWEEEVIVDYPYEREVREGDVLTGAEDGVIPGNKQRNGESVEKPEKAKKWNTSYSLRE